MRGDIETSPVALLRPPTREFPRGRVLNDEETRAIWKHSDAEDYTFGPFLKLLLITGQRRSEIAGMRWSELNLDEGIWELPASCVKNARLHIVPLPPQAVDILQTLHRFLDSDLVFKTPGRSATSGFGPLKERIEATLPENTPDWCLHDFRRTASTGIARIGVAPHVIDAVTYHKSGVVSGVGATYNRCTCFNEKLEALEHWADHLTELSSLHSQRYGAELWRATISIGKYGCALLPISSAISCFQSAGIEPSSGRLRKKTRCLTSK